MNNLFPLAAIASTLCLAPQFTLAEMNIEERLSPGQSLAVISHRAVGGGAPENSLAGIQYAIERGVDMVEIDIQMTREGQFILMHDWSLRRTTNVEDVFPDGAPSRVGETSARQYRVSDFTLDEIASLQLTDPSGGDHPVPTLEAALELADDKLFLMLELKNWNVGGLAAVLEKYDTNNLLIWTKSNPWKLRETAEATGIGVAYISSAESINNRLEREFELFGSYFKLAGITFSELSPELISEAAELGVAVDVDTRFFDPFERDGTVSSWLTAIRDSGAAAAWTSEPDEMLEALGR